MPIARVHLCLIESLMYPITAALSFCRGVGGCGCPISFNVVHFFFASFSFRNTDPISAYAADDITCLRTVLMIKMAPLVSLFWLSMLLPI
jgi:hypothetical protein